MRWAVFAFALEALVGCARHVVIAPNDVAAHNDPDWTVAREPDSSRYRPK